MEILDNIKETMGDQLNGYHLVRPLYEKNGCQVAWFTNNIVDKYVITDGEKILDVQVD